MLNQWFKFYGVEYLGDPKIASLSAQERSCWLTLLCLASASTEPGTIDYLTVEVLLEKSGIKWDPYHPEEWNACLNVITKFVKMKMITSNDEGRIVILNWNKRQEHAMTGYERVKKYRERKAILASDNVLITDDNGDDNCREDKIREDKNRIYTTSFDLFWVSYPKKVGKQDALKAWKKLTPNETLISEISSGLEAWKKSPQWTKDDGRFIPNPATFLNGRRWEDEVAVKKPSVSKYDSFKSIQV